MTNCSSTKLQQPVRKYIYIFYSKDFLNMGSYQANMNINSKSLK